MRINYSHYFAKIIKNEFYNKDKTLKKRHRNEYNAFLCNNKLEVGYLTVILVL